MKLGDQIKQRLTDGQKYSQITRELGVAGSTISYHAKKMGITRNPNYHKHDWEAIQAYYDAGNNLSSTKMKFDLRHDVLQRAKERGDLKLDYNRDNSLSFRFVTADKIFVKNSLISTASVKRYILKNDLVPYFCVIKICPLYEMKNPIWAGQKIVLHLDHKNGIRNDHRLDNLRFLCPNCHSQTMTYCGRNIGKIH